LLLEAISKINDPELKASMLHKLRKMLNQKEATKDDKLPKPTISLSETLERFNKLKPKKLSLEDLQSEINQIKREIIQLKAVNEQLESQNAKLEGKNNKLEDRVSILELDKIFKPTNNNDSSSEDENPKSSTRRMNKSDDEIRYCNLLNKITPIRWHTNVKLIIDDHKIEVIVLVDSGADLNCIQEGLIPTKYFEKSTERLNSANGSKMHIKYEINNAHVCKDKVCFKTSFVLVKNLNDKVILGLPFIHLLLPFTTDVDGITTAPFGQPVKFNFLNLIEENDIKILKDNLISQSICLIKNKQKHLKFLKDEVHYQRVQQQLNCKILQQKIERFHEKLNQEVCSNFPNAFWNRKTHVVKLPYVKDFNERNIPTKARPIQMNQEIMEFCKNEINDLLEKKIIRPGKSPWSCPAFYVQKNAELERGAPRLVINYKPLNKVLEWIRYPIPNKQDLINRLSDSVVFSKFDLKSGFWQIQIHEDDKYKTAFTTPFGHYEWNVMPFGLKNAPSEFQNIMNDIFNPFSKFCIVYIDDVLIFSKSIEEHWKHLNSFLDTIKYSGLVVSSPKIKLFQTKI
jgi:hypothetical protein